MSFRKVLLATAAIMALTSHVAVAEVEQTELKSVLVTGASSGIGRRIAETLAANGYFVYAGARKPADMDALNRLENVRAIRLDVTRQDEIDAAVETVRSEGRGLYAVVNNAGVLITGPSTEIGVDQVEWLFDVNVLGVYRVTQTFAPLIIESRGRIVNIGSIAGSIGIEFLGAYSMSKHAIEAYTDSLAKELSRFGVHVSIVAPGDYETNIWKDDIAKARMAGVVDDNSPYAEDYRAWIEVVASLELKKPDEVADTVLDALSVETPARRYLVVPDEGEMAWVMGSIIERVAEMNHGHPHTYSEEELSEMLLEAIDELDQPGE